MVALVFSNLQLKSVRTVCRGIIDYERRNGPWHFLFAEGRREDQNFDLKRLDADGAIVQNTALNEVFDILALGIPVILSESWAEPPVADHPLAGVPFVKMDSAGVGALAARYYLERGYRSFAYVGETRDMGWDI